MKKFEQEYYCEFIKPSPKYELAFKLWVEYYYYTEEYDRNVCSGFDDVRQVAIPVSGYEYIRSNKNAKELFRQLNEMMHVNEIDKETSNRAKREALRYTHEQLKHWIESS